MPMRNVAQVICNLAIEEPEAIETEKIVILDDAIFQGRQECRSAFQVTPTVKAKYKRFVVRRAGKGAVGVTGVMV